MAAWTWRIVAAALALGGCGETPAAPEVVAPAELGEVIVLGRGFDIESKVMGDTRRLNIYTPPGYGEAGTTYPVLYLLDGGAQQDFVHIAGLAQHGWISGSFADVIVVGIGSKDRRRELAHLAVNDASLKAEYPTHGESKMFREFLAAEVKPWVEDHYAASGHDVVMGESLAGLFVVETFLRQPDLFDGYIAVDPSLWWDHEALSKEAAGLVAAHAGGDHTVFIAGADEGPEMRSGQDRVVAALEASRQPGLKVIYRPMADERHSTIYHRAALDALRILFAKTPERASP